MSYFTDLPRGQVRLGAAGKVMTAAEAAGVLDAGCDFVVIGRAAILRHDFPERVRRDAAYVSPATPVTVQHLSDEGLSPRFVQYMRQWPGFVEDEKAA
jgi:2,4-dienoyl-CoA reductase-like NADH-dependent reductase (Old Yellow Enzyme family)